MDRSHDQEAVEGLGFDMYATWPPICQGPRDLGLSSLLECGRTFNLKVLI